MTTKETREEREEFKAWLKTLSNGELVTMHAIAFEDNYKSYQKAFIQNELLKRLGK